MKTVNNSIGAMTAMALMTMQALRSWRDHLVALHPTFTPARPARRPQRRPDDITWGFVGLVMGIVVGAALVSWSVGKWHGYEEGFIDGMVQARPKMATAAPRPFPYLPATVKEPMGLPAPPQGVDYGPQEQ